MGDYDDPASDMGDLVTSLNTADDDGILESLASATTAQTLTGASLDGVLMSAGAIAGSEARNITAATSANAGSYVDGSQIVVQGKKDGQPVEVRFTIVGTDGGQTFTGYLMFDPLEPLTVILPACVNTGGAFTVGVGVGKRLTPIGRRPTWLDVVTASGEVSMHLAKAGQDSVVNRTFSTAGPKTYSVDAVFALNGSELQSALE
jgi:hypothetical protein